MNKQNNISFNSNDSLHNNTEIRYNRINNDKSDDISYKYNNFEKIILDDKRPNSIIEISSAKKYTKDNIKNQIHKKILNITDKIEQNGIEINELKKQLINLKKEKKKKKEDIINLLSNKESIEEIYKNKIYALINQEQIIKEKNNEDDVEFETKDHIINMNLNEIRESDKNKFSEQIINMVNNIFQRQNNEVNNSILNLINSCYELIKGNNFEDNENLIIDDFFTKISLYISNQSFGKLEESEINSLLRYLLQINITNIKLEKYMKFVNKKYKEQKKELNNFLTILEKKNKNLIEKKIDLENNLKEYEENHLKNSIIISSNEKENKSPNNNVYRNKKQIIYIKKNISKNNNFSKKFQTNGTKNDINIIKTNNIKQYKEKESIKELEKNFKKDNNKINQEFILDNEKIIEKNEEIINGADNLNKQNNYENELIKKGINPFINEILSVNISEEKNKDKKKNEYIFKNNINKEFLDNNYNKENCHKKDINIVYLKEKRKTDRKSLMKKINDYTYNISINNNNQNIFTQNNSKNNKDNINNKIQNNLNLPKKSDYNEKEEFDNEEIITYKISSINKDKLQEISNNKTIQNNFQNENIIGKYNSNIILTNNDYNRIFNKNSLYQKDKCLTNNDEKSHNFISIINITNNATMQNKQMTLSDEEKICNIDNFENENTDEIKINTMEIKNNILKKSKNFDIKNIDYLHKKENKDNNFEIINNENNNTKREQTKNSYRNKLNKFINKNSGINDINKRSVKNKSLSLNLTSARDTNNISSKLFDSYITDLNNFNSKTNNTLSPIKNTKNDNKNKNKNKNSFFNNLNSSTLKITKSKEINIKDIKNNKINIFNIKKLSKTINLKNSTKQIHKFFSNSRDKLYLKQHKIINDNSNKKNLESFNEINKEKHELLRGFSLNKINRNNLSWDKSDSTNNKIKIKEKLSPDLIKKLKLINLPVSKNQKLKTDYSKNMNKDKSNKYNFYQYINSIHFGDKYINMTKQSICFYRIYNKNNIKINLTETNSQNLEIIGFSRGYISIILKSDLLRFLPKINNNNEINIILKNIIGIQIEQEMQNITNKIYNTKKSMDKVKINNIFVFNLLISDYQGSKIECVFENYDIYMFWMKFLEEIAEYYRNNDNIFDIN